MVDEELLTAVRQAVGIVLSDAEVHRIAATAAAWEADDGELLIEEGQAASQGYIVVRGTAAVVVRGAKVARLGPGSLVWADADRAAMPAVVRAEGPMWLLLLGPDTLRTLRERDVSQLRRRTLR
jgi:CRP-like cAMP-binding protein